MTKVTRFSTALRPHVTAKIEQLGYADIVIGIPAYHSAGSIVHVIKTVVRGIERYYPTLKAVIMVSDGGSTDDTRDLARTVDPKSYNIELIVTIYRGIPGKGSGLRAVFEVAAFLKARAVTVFDSDLLSITPEWIQNFLEPVFSGYDYVAPHYDRYKLDGTITNTIAYNLTRALYGMRVRQPIGGDFGLSPPLVKHYLDQDVWATDIAKFGIDIWMTTSAIVGGFRICQAKLGAKLHDHKDPSTDLGPMFRQVVGTTFLLMDQYHDHWAKIRGSAELPALGEFSGSEAEAFDIDQANLIEYFKVGLNNFHGVWKNIIEGRDLKIVEELARSDRNDQFLMPIDTWVRIVYRYAIAFHRTPRQRFKVLDTLTPLYYGRVGSLVNELRDKTPEEAEEHFEQNALVFETMKDYLVELWEGKEQ
ncbi:MAG: glycosyltransferase [Deltaproteobacteria bacterium]|nr:glycosyltransferase [Deltaproteobacteria bacterium]